MTVPINTTEIAQHGQPAASKLRAISTLAIWLVVAIAALAAFAVANVALDLLPMGVIAEFVHDGRHILGVPGH